MAHNLTRQVQTIRLVNSTVAGTSNITSAAVDTLGFDAVRAVVLMGTLTASQVTKVKLQSSAVSASGYGDITGSETAAAADADSNKMLITEAYRPPNRYVKVIVERGTANAAIDGVVVELYRHFTESAPVDTTVSQEIVLANGVAATS